MRVTTTRAGASVGTVAVSVRPVDLESWDDAPEVCRLAATEGPVRHETAVAMTAFMQWLALAVDPARHSEGIPWYLSAVREKSEDGYTIMLVPPAGYEAAWAGDRRAASRGRAAQVVSRVITVELTVMWTAEPGSGASPLVGWFNTSLFENAWSAGQWGVGVQFCVLPAVDGVAPVYLYQRSIS